MVVCYSPVYRSPVSLVATAPEHLIGRHVFHFVPVSVPSGKCHAVTSGVLLACYSPDSWSHVSLVATARIHTLLTDMLDVVSCMPVPVS